MKKLKNVKVIFLGVVATVDATALFHPWARWPPLPPVNLEKSNCFTAIVKQHKHYIADLSRFVVCYSASKLSHPHGAPSIRQLRRGHSSIQL
jgi:hypothetical protein